MADFYSRSIEVIKDGQSTSGAYIASPNFPTYQYCWLRDASFIAHAMDTAGEFNSADAYFRWTSRVIQKYAGKLEGIRKYLEKEIPIKKDDILHTRYTLDGNEVTTDSKWGNFQIDGYGTWLWALAEHIARCGKTELLNELKESVRITIEYLDLVWSLPNYDCWEEYPEFIHPYSLACVFAGFRAVEKMSTSTKFDLGPVRIQNSVDKIKDFILRYAVSQGCFVKHVLPSKDGNPPAPFLQSGVDSSLIGLAVPYELLEPGHPLIQTTIQSIERDLHRPGGGLYRYKTDVYYGGGEWLLLSAWLGWYYTRVGAWDRANDLRLWIESQADENGFFAEQSSEHVLSPSQFDPWVKKWGQVAKPLLWSHAMYLILVEGLRQNR
jgi:GH15 family glucan-1,4-alpha-glucosidase